MHGMGILNKEVKEAQHGWPEQGHGAGRGGAGIRESRGCLLYTSDAADDSGVV